MSRAYTVHEINALRQACENKWLFGTACIPPRPCTSRAFREEEKTRCVEELVRTYMIAGLTAGDLLKADSSSSN